LFIAEFNVNNFTSLTWRVHDFTVQVLAQGQMFATARADSRPAPIRPKTEGRILIQCYLNEFQAGRVQEASQWSLTMPTTLYVNAQMESKLGIFEFSPTINNLPAQIIGLRRASL
jgi:hypothetical protein